jgi:hypothetical protein
MFCLLVCSIACETLGPSSSTWNLNPAPCNPMQIIDRISEYKENVGSVLSVLEQSSDFRVVPIDANISFQQLQDDLTVMTAREIAV